MTKTAGGLRVIVTAGAAGIGRALAETFAEAGAGVFICDVDRDTLSAMKRERPAIEGVVADVADPAQVDAMFAAAARFLGGLDVLINNAGIAGPTACVEDISVEDWNRTIAVDLNGMFYCTRLAVPLLKAAGGGSIVNLSSVAGRLGFAMRTPYSSAKWAVVGFTKSLANELGPSNIRVNAIQPGLVDGERLRNVIRSKAKALNVTEKEFEAQLVSRVSLRRMVSAQDIANMALFLATPAGANISGQALSVCGNVESIV
jgi:NAD(P)-dependent dehydrogenase (short-subunit alcohol dehydrogenase family)